nr:unnamed protein product [Callosobruchus chinensis]
MHFSIDPATPRTHTIGNPRIPSPATTARQDGGGAALAKISVRASCHDAERRRRRSATRHGRDLTCVECRILSFFAAQEIPTEKQIQLKIFSTLELRWTLSNSSSV